MAEYAGLEIRIGGDTRKLTNALKASTKSAAELQAQIRQITRAMQFDPTNLANVETRIKITGDRMQSLQSKAQLAKTAMEQLGDSFTHMQKADGSFKTVRELAAETGNLSLSAKQADDRFVRLRDTLSTIYEAWNEAARVKGVNFLRDTLRIDAKTADSLMSTSTSLGTLLAELKEYQRMRRESIDPDGPLISNEEIETVRQLKQLDFHGMFEKGTNLDSLIQQARDLGIVIDEDVVSSVRDMRKEFVEAQQAKQDFDRALQFGKLGTDIQRYDSEIVALSNDIRRIDDDMTKVSSSEPFQGLEAHVRDIDAALDRVNKDLERTEAALKLDPDNIDLAVRRFSDLQQIADLSNDRVSILKEQLAMLDSTGASEAAKDHRDLALWVEESAEAARKAGIDYASQKAAVSNLSDAVESLKHHIASLGGDSSTVAMTKNVQEWLTKTQQLEAETQKLAGQKKSLEDLQAKLTVLQDKAAQADEEVERWASALDQLRSDRYDLLTNISMSDDADEIAMMTEQLRLYDNAINELGSRYETANLEASQFAGELSTLKDSIREVEGAVITSERRITNYSSALEKLEQTPEVSAFKDFPAEVEKSREELAKMEGDLREARTEEERLKNAYESAKSENELAKTTKKVGELKSELADTTNNAQTAEKAIKGLDLGSVINPSTLKSIGMTLSATVTPLVTGIGYGMIEASQTVDSAYRDMRKTVEGTEQQFEQLRESAIEFSRTHVTSADQILQIEAIGGELGVATEDLQTFAEVISNIDVASNLDVEDAAAALGHLANIMGLTEEDFVGFSDALVRLGNNGASTESEIANIAERIGSMGSIVGMSASDVLAWASSIASTGQNAEAAGTAISKTMSFFETAVASAGGTLDTSFEAIDRAVQEGGSSLVIFSNLMETTAEQFAEDWATNPQDVFEKVTDAVDGAKDSLQSIADVTHMSADEFAKAWESDPTSVMQAFIKGLNEVEDAGGSADAVLQGFGITSVRQKQAIEGLMQTINGLDDNLEMSRDAWNGISDGWGKAGDAANEAAKKAEGFSGQIQILKNIGQIALSELGEGAVPYIKMLSGSIEDLSAWFSGLGTVTKTVIVGIGGVTAAMGPLLTMVSTGITAFHNVSDWMDEAVNATALVKTAFASGGEEAVKALTGTMTKMQKAKVIAADMGASIAGMLKTGLIVAGIAAISAALAKLYSDWKTHVKATEGFSDALAGIGKAANDASIGLASSASDMQKVMMEAGGYEKRLASLSDTINESNAEYGAYAGRLEYYGDVIRDLGGKSGLTREEMAKLSAAVKAVNDECGTTYAVDEYGNIIDESTGKVQANTDALLANIDARKSQALFEYYADDYAQATEQWAEAQARVNSLQEQYDKLTSDSGREEYLQSYMDKVGGDREAALEAYAVRVDGVRQSLDGAKEELGKTSTAMSDLEAQMDVAKAKMDEANRTIEESAKVQEEYDRRVSKVTKDTTGNMSRLSAAVTDAGKGDGAFNAIAAGLDSIHVYANELDNVDMASLVSAFDGVDGSMEQVISTLEEAGVSTKTWHAALEQAPEAAERMGTLSAAAFDSLYRVAGEDLGATMELIAGLDEVKVDDKTFFIGDDGTIMDETGRIYDLQKDLGDIPSMVITKLAGDDIDLRNKILEDKRQLDGMDGRRVTTTIDAVDYASAKIDYINRRLGELGNKRTNTVIVATEQATGGMNNRPVIPRHAMGYIATGPTLTNQGWIGEDGIEAVANWATGGAVVPLTNKRYMLPIANAIADGMAAHGIGGGGTSVVVNLNYEAGTDANALAQDVGRAVARAMRTRG